MVDAKKVRQNIAKMTNKVSSVASGRVQPHKHCRICFTPIKLSADPRVCKEQECIDKNERDERNQKQMRIWMFIFFGIFAFGFVGPILFRLL
jgi:predicted nucleic acid-binding Zn ribbon protein|tara:strand:+ start:2645 stop:2920 length:276 start_codon:yes stop_codon:yes gene_type:complete